MTWHYDILIRESYLDTFGHVNNATYLALYEEARWELVTSNGYGLPEVQKFAKGPVILETTIKFMAELKLRDRIKITIEESTIKGKIMTLKQRMIKEDGTFASEATFIFGLFDLKARKLVEPTSEWLKAISLTSSPSSST